MNDRVSDPVMLNDWHPVTAAAALAVGSMQAVRLLEHELIVWRSADGTVHAWDDRCPHRGVKLSLGRVVQDRVECAYHGWQFAPGGQCVLQPAYPHETPPKMACAQRFHAAEAYGMVWVCLGEPVRKRPPFPEYADARLRKVLCGPYKVNACGPRVVENFIDMAHFPFIHTGILGDLGHIEMPDYKVGPYDDGLGPRGMQGVIATECFAYQPVSNLLAKDGAMVEYTYRVVWPLTAILTKLPEKLDGFAEAISLHVQPMDEEHCNVWIVVAMTNTVSIDAEVRAFQDKVFGQDLAVLESQRPKRLPLTPGVEIPQRADKLSLAYRRMLKESGLRYGVM
jgi:phenylpropionate dioxygenase-like ring-hydroxylating dioxygenase large terminal subunit